MATQFATIVLLLTAAVSEIAAADLGWPAYGGSPEQTRYSKLDQIRASNVNDLRIAWTYDTGDAFSGSEMQCNPLVIDGVFYATSPKLRVIALDAATGKLRWRFDPHEGRPYSRKSRNRGLTYWTDGKQGRIYYAVQQWLYALDTGTGRPAEEFGKDGRIDLRENLGRDPEEQNVSLTSPGVVYKDLLIVGSITAEDLPASPGDIRAYDVRSGKLRWSFHTIPHPGEFGYDTWPPDAWKSSGAANDWAGMALDAKRGLVFVPTGSAAFDFYGPDRHGDNLFANCLLALRADTGERVWHFQVVRHDLWDRDLPAPPSLVTLTRDGRKVEAVAQTTKSGHVFVFERETGKPLFPIEYRSVPQSDAPGEQTAERQPLPLRPPPFARQRLSEDLITDRTPEARQAVLEALQLVHNEGQFTPPSVNGTVIFPGFDGGAEWGGSAFDSESGLLYVNSNEMAWIVRLVERVKAGARATGRSLYEGNCASCHRSDLRGTPPEFPSLVDLGRRRGSSDVQNVIRKGAGRMPAFSNLPPSAVAAIAAYLLRGEEKEVVSHAIDSKARPSLRYTITGYNKLLDPNGYPGIKPRGERLTRSI